MRKMNKLYYENQYIKEFSTDIINVQKRDDKYLIELKDTAFFEGGGGQSRDYGTIDGIEIQDALVENNKILYVLSKEPENKKEVNCIVDWDNRLDYMQQHSAQHVLSGCFYKLFHDNTAGIHLGSEISYVDIVGVITKDKIVKAEEYANKIICENRKFNFTITKRDEAEKMGLRRDLQTDDDIIRVVEIEGLDINACCGVHLSNTKELQLIKIINFEKHKGNTRIYYKAGKRAVDYVLKSSMIFDEICSSLSTGMSDVLATINNIIMENNKLKDENSKMQLSIAEIEAEKLIKNSEKINETLLVHGIYKDKDKKFLNKIINKVTFQKKSVIVIANISNNKVSITCACSKNIKNINMNDIIKYILPIINGKGGGNGTLSQGTGIEIQNTEKAIDISLSKIKEVLIRL